MGKVKSLLIALIYVLFAVSLILILCGFIAFCVNFVVNCNPTWFQTFSFSSVIVISTLVVWYVIDKEKNKGDMRHGK